VCNNTIFYREVFISGILYRHFGRPIYGSTYSKVYKVLVKPVVKDGRETWTCGGERPEKRQKL